MCNQHNWKETNKISPHTGAESVVYLHNWKETNKISPHTGAESVVYLLCETCGQSGFRRPPSRVVYTWQKVKNEKN